VVTTTGNRSIDPNESTVCQAHLPVKQRVQEHLTDETWNCQNLHKNLLLAFRRHDSVVGIATTLRAGRSGDRKKNPGGAHPASCTMGTGSFPGVKTAGTWCWQHTLF